MTNTNRTHTDLTPANPSDISFDEIEDALNYFAAEGETEHLAGLEEAISEPGHGGRLIRLIYRYRTLTA